MYLEGGAGGGEEGGGEEREYEGWWGDYEDDGCGDYEVVDGRTREGRYESEEMSKKKGIYIV